MSDIVSTIMSGRELKPTSLVVIESTSPFDNPYRIGVELRHQPSSNHKKFYLDAFSYQVLQLEDYLVCNQKS